MREGKGVIEVLKTKGSPPLKGEITIYFYKDPSEARGESFEPWDSIPESVELVVGKNRIPLEVQDDAFVTPSGPLLFGNRDIEGQLNIVVDGETIVTPLNAER